jgi:hypothetical protein
LLQITKHHLLLRLFLFFNNLGSFFSSPFSNYPAYVFLHLHKHFSKVGSYDCPFQGSGFVKFYSVATAQTQYAHTIANLLTCSIKIDELTYLDVVLFIWVNTVNNYFNVLLPHPPTAMRRYVFAFANQ